MIKIKRKQSTLAEGTTSISDAVLASVSVGEGSRKKFTLMSEDYITLKFSLAEDVCFQVGDYVDEDITGYYFITEPSLPTYNTETEGYDYSQEMKAYYMLWQNHFMRYSPKTSGSEVSWSLTTTIETHAQVFVDNVNAIDSYKGAKYTFVIDKTNVKEGSVLISYNATGMIDALNMIAQAFECEWWIIGSVIYFGRCENGTEMDFDLSKKLHEHEGEQVFRQFRKQDCRIRRHSQHHSEIQKETRVHHYGRHLIRREIIRIRFRKAFNGDVLPEE